MPVFDEAAEAGLMLPYTDNKPQSRHAVLALNYNGGGGMEIWQYTGRTPQAPQQAIQYGDLGILCNKFKVKDVKAYYAYCIEQKLNVLCPVTTEAHGISHFFMKDPWGNVVEITEALDWFKNASHQAGGVVGVTIGVSDVESSLYFYQRILGYDHMVSDVSGSYSDLEGQEEQPGRYRRVLLNHSEPRTGPFSRLLGSTSIELVQCLDREPQKVFAGRLWGDLGYIHLCFDVQGMGELKKSCEAAGHGFTVDSAESFDMGEAAGRFAYVEDPDGTLIEFVEAHKIPIIKKLGWYLDLRKRKPGKSLPNYFFAAMALSRKKSPVA